MDNLLQAFRQQLEQYKPQAWPFQLFYIVRCYNPLTGGGLEVQSMTLNKLPSCGLEPEPDHGYNNSMLPLLRPIQRS